MSDEVLSIDVQDQAIDQAIARLDAALTKKQQLTGQPTQNGPNGIIINESPTQQQIAQQKIRQSTLKPYIETPKVDTTQLTTAEARADQVRAKVEAVSVEANAKLSKAEADTAGVAAKTTVIADEAKSVVSSEGAEIKGLESASNRILRMIPGLREASRLKRDIGLVNAGSMMGVLGLLMLAYSIYQQANRMLEDQKQQQEEYKSLIIQAQNFTSNSQYQAWQTQMTNALSYRSRPIVK